MEECILKFIAMILSISINSIVILAVYIMIHILLYILFGINIIDVFLKFVAKLATVEIGGKS